MLVRIKSSCNNSLIKKRSLRSNQPNRSMPKSRNNNASNTKTTRKHIKTTRNQARKVNNNNLSVSPTSSPDENAISEEESVEESFSEANSSLSDVENGSINSSTEASFSESASDYPKPSRTTRNSLKARIKASAEDVLAATKREIAQESNPRRVIASKQAQKGSKHICQSLLQHNDPKDVAFYQSIQRFRGFKHLPAEEKEEIIEEEREKELDCFIPLKHIYNSVQSELDSLIDADVVQNPLHFRDLLLYFFETDKTGRLRRLCLNEPQFLVYILTIIRRIKHGPADLDQIQSNNSLEKGPIYYVVENPDYDSDDNDADFDPNDSGTGSGSDSSSGEESGCDISSSGSDSSTTTSASEAENEGTKPKISAKKRKLSISAAPSAKKSMKYIESGIRHISWKHCGQNIKRNDIIWPPVAVSAFPTEKRDKETSFALKMILDGRTVLRSYTYTNGKIRKRPSNSNKNSKNNFTNNDSNIKHSTTSNNNQINSRYNINHVAPRASQPSSKITSYFSTDNSTKFTSPESSTNQVAPKSSKSQNLAEPILNSASSAEEKKESSRRVISSRSSSRNSNTSLQESKEASPSNNKARNNNKNFKSIAAATFGPAVSPSSRLRSYTVTPSECEFASSGQETKESAAQSAQESKDNNSTAQKHHHHHHHHALSNTALKRRGIRPAEFMSSGISYRLVGIASGREQSLEWFTSLIQCRDDFHLFFCVIVYLAVIGIADDEHLGNLKHVIFFNSLITKANYGEQQQSRSFRTSTNKKTMTAEMMYKFDAMCLELVQRDLIPPLPLPTLTQLLL
jgi:hypothetical protein